MKSESKDKGLSYQLKITGSEVVVEKSEDINTSCFREEYLHIFRVIEKIVKNTEENLKREREAKEWGSYCPDIRLHNIVPIMGKRGAGKSSILHSVAGILNNGAHFEGSNYQNDSKHKNILNEFYGTDGSLKDKHFIVLDCIDGSLLEHNEDIFPTILAQMYQKERDLHIDGSFPIHRNREMHDGNISYDERELLKEFEKLYRSACQVGDNWYGGYRPEEMSPLTSLNQLSDSLKLRQDFRSLLKKFTTVYSRYKYYQNNKDYSTFIVIPIDDLDLNIDHGYEMLEKIHRYLMVPNVIILMAFDQKQLLRLSEFRFYKMIPTFDSRMNASAIMVGRLAEQYLEKVMPSDFRTYVPSFADQKEITVTLARDDNSFQKEYYRPKHLVFRLLYQKTGMRMDTGGEKHHTFERNSLRTFVNFINMLYEMESPVIFQKSGSTINIDIFRHNYRILRQEIVQGIATHLLSDEVALTQYLVPDATTVTSFRNQPMSSLAKFERIINTTKPLPRAFRRFCLVVREEGELASRENKLHQGNVLYELSEDLKFYDYNYGEVLRVIYEYGRFNDENKQLIRCLLVYYSLELIKNYIILHTPTSSNIEKKEDRQCFIQTMNGSVIGSWANEMMPAVNIGHTSYQCGFRIKVAMRDVFRIRHRLILESLKFEESATDSSEVTKRFLLFVQSVSIIGMFFDHPNYKLPEMFKWNDILENGTNKEQEENDELQQKIDFLKAELEEVKSIMPGLELPGFRPVVSGEGTFSFLGFVTSVFQFENRGEKLLHYTKAYLLETFPKYSKEINNAINNVTKEFIDWSGKYSGFALPVYDIDVCYNIFKRVLQDSYGKPDTIGIKDLFSHYLDTYVSIAKRLRENDDDYEKRCKVDIKGNQLTSKYLLHYRFYDSFCNCPYMKWLGISQRVDEKPVSQDSVQLYNQVKDLLVGNGDGDEKLQPGIFIQMVGIDDDSRDPKSIARNDHRVISPSGYND